MPFNVYRDVAIINILKIITKREIHFAFQVNFKIYSIIVCSVSQLKEMFHNFPFVNEFEKLPWKHLVLT